MRFLCLLACFLAIHVVSSDDEYDYSYYYGEEEVEDDAQDAEAGQANERSSELAGSLALHPVLEDEEVRDPDQSENQNGKGEEYEHEQSKQVPATTPEEPVVIRPDPEFRAQVACSSERITLTLDRTVLPLGLGFADSLPEELVATNNGGGASCIRVTHNSTHFKYEASMQCRRAVGKLKFGQTTIYSHELVIDDIRPRSSAKPGEFYSIIMDCITSSQRSRDLIPQGWTPEIRVFEHRLGPACSQLECPHGELCLPRDNVNGYFCSCSDLEDGCNCPGDFYGCSGGRNSTSTNIICVGNNHLCDSKDDCPLKDDEVCSDIMDPWSTWSECDASCGKGKQTRERSCAHGFTEDASRIPRTPCIDHQSSDSESRACDRGSCSAVSCATDEMKIEIPLEFGMTRKSVEQRMYLRDARDENGCAPSVNDTHATFVIPLHLCKTVTWVDGDIVYYSNTIVYQIEDQSSAIIVREYGHSYTAKCQYKRRQTVGVRTFAPSDDNFEEIAVLKFGDDPANLNREADSLDMVTHYSSGDGVFEYNMNIYEDSSYSSPYTVADYPLEKKLGERLFIAVDFKSQDEDLNVFIERCWAVSSSSSGIEYDDARYLFINGGCPVDPTLQFHNENSTHFSDRYSIESFKFNDAQYWYIYFRCDVIVCDTSEDDPACYRRCDSMEPNEHERRKREAPRPRHTYSRVTQGPLVVVDKKDFIHRNWRSGFSTGSVEHTVLTAEDAPGSKVLQKTTGGRGAGFMNSPYILPAIVGSVCLMIGVSVGLMMRRKNAKSARKSAESKEIPDNNRDESAEVMIQDC